jgi:hypothetical protein
MQIRGYSLHPALPQQASPWRQHAPPKPQAGPAGLLAFVIAPAPPLISRLTWPPHSGQTESGFSDIFWRFSKRWLHAAHWYS